MYETSLDKVLNYMKQYVENRFEHDSEPMLNYKDLELVLNYINKQKEVLDKIKKYCNHKLEMLELQKRNIMQILTPENGYLKTDIEIEMQKYKDILELLEEIE